MQTVQIAAVPIEELVAESWEGVLHRLTADMDPWDIDIAELAQRYRAYLQALREFEFTVPGRMVLTCSVLLRMKSDVLLAAHAPTPKGDLVAELEDAVDAAMEAEAPIDPGEFSLPVVRKPARQVTLRDLEAALTGAMKVSRRRAGRLIERASLPDDERDPFEGFEIGGQDFTDRLRGVLDRIKKLLSGRRVLSFFRLLDQGDKNERVRRFFEVLHLAADGQICCSQKEFLGDILIRLESET